MSVENAIKNNRPRRSEKLTDDLMQAFKEKVDSFDTITDAVEFFGFSRVALSNTLLRGTAKPSTVAIIREKLGIAA